MISFVRAILRRLFPPPRPVLIAMRRVDMHMIHPQMISAYCSSCGYEVGIFPSGQKVLRTMPDVVIMCHFCRPPGDHAVLAPGAEHEPRQSVRKQ